MVQLMKSGNLRSESSEKTSPRGGGEKVPVKLEIVEDSLEEEHGPYNKRSKTLQQFNQWGSETDSLSTPPSQYNLLDEPSPLGLRLRKSPSLLDLIQMKLSQGNASAIGPAPGANSSSGDKKDVKGSGAVSGTDKLKASNFPASLLRIGSWEYASRYEGDLVAKCYFAKHKLVWEVLDGGLKSKIEIQWSDIMALKANCPENGPGTLNVVLARQPLFFRETNPQPRKHTLWQATADFTDGQASIHRQHFLQCPQGLLNKHFEKLIQCDMRLNFLSKQSEIVLDSPYFESRPSVFEDLDDCKSQISHVETGKGSALPTFREGASPNAAQSTLNPEKGDVCSRGLAGLPRETPSHLSAVDTRATEGSGGCEANNSRAPRNWDQIKVPGLHPSMSMSDLMSHIGNCITEQINSGNAPFAGDGVECKDILEDIAQYLLSDTQLTSASDEKSIMSRVNSLCCLLQKDPPSVPNLQNNGESCFDLGSEGKSSQHNVACELITENKGCRAADVAPQEGDAREFSGCKQPSAMSRKDSFGELLLHLPRIASLPKFLFNISEDGEYKAR